MHEQENAKVKGVGGVIGLTENPAALSRWMICGPEIARLLDEFESDFHISTGESEKGHLHHEEGLASQRTFKKRTQSLIDTITNLETPLDDCPELLILNSRDCADDSVITTVRSSQLFGHHNCSVITTVRSIDAIATAQYQNYCNDVIVTRNKSIHDTIKKNSLPLFKTRKCKKKSKTSQQLTVQRNNAALFGRLYIANQQRAGDPLGFLSHENQMFPPSLSDFGKICFGQKSLLLGHLDSSGMHNPSEFCQCKILDGAAVVHFLSTDSVKTFVEYADKVFIPFLLQQLQQACRVDCVWDRYLPHSIKEATREHRGHGTRTKVSQQTKMPKKKGVIS